MSGLLDFGKKAVGADSYQAQQRPIDKADFQDPNGGAMRNEESDQYRRANERAAPTAGAAQLDPNSLERVQGANAGPANLSQQGQTQGAYTYNGAQTGTAQAGDSSFRNNQGQLISQLEDQAAGRGPSLAAEQLKQGMDAQLAGQNAMAASHPGGNAAIQQRQLATGAQAADRHLAQDTTQARIQEQMAARAQLGNVLQGARGQDLQLSQGNAGMAQQSNLANAGFQQQAGLAGMDARNQLNQFNAQLGQQNNQFNAGAQNQFAQSMADRQQQANLANQGYGNQARFQNTQNQQQTNLANLQAQLQTMGMNDEQIRAIMGLQLAQNEADRQANMGYEDLATRQQMAAQGLDAASWDRSAGRAQGTVGGVANGAGALLALSDPKSKNDVVPLIDKSDSEQLRVGGDGKAFYSAPASDSSEGASLSRLSPRYSVGKAADAAPAPKSSPKPSADDRQFKDDVEFIKGNKSDSPEKSPRFYDPMNGDVKRKPSDDQLYAMADKMGRDMEQQHAASMAAGPAVGDAEPWWLKQYAVTSDPAAKSGIAPLDASFGGNGRPPTDPTAGVTASAPVGVGPTGAPDASMDPSMGSLDVGTGQRVSDQDAANGRAMSNITASQNKWQADQAKPDDNKGMKALGQVSSAVGKPMEASSRATVEGSGGGMPGSSFAPRSFGSFLSQYKFSDPTTKMKMKPLAAKMPLKKAKY
jgi:hypothetical protein